MNRNTLTAAVLLSLGSAGLAHTAQAATLSSGTVLTINAGVEATDANGNPTNVSSGSWFGMDTDGNAKIKGTEKTTIGMGTTGLVIGATSTAGASHTGLVVTGDTNAITAPWAFFGNTGSDYMTVAPTGSTTSGLNFSGWTVTWNSIPAINMGSGAWTAGYTSGVANIVCYSDSAMTTVSATCSTGEYYKLDYAATVPAGDPSGFGGVKYFLHLEGAITANTPPVASAASVSTTSSSTASWTPGATDANGDTPLTCEMVSQPASGQGTATVSPDCSTGTYTPGGFTGPSTSFTYRACDPHGNCGTAATVSVEITLTPRPVCNADSATASGTTGVSISVLGNDTDGDNNIDASSVTIGTNGSNGTATANADGTVTYTSSTNTGHTDTFTYTVRDTTGQSCTTAGTVTVTVTPQITYDLSYSKTTSGCSLTDGRVNPAERGDWWIVAGFLAWLGALRMRFKRQTQS